MRLTSTLQLSFLLTLFLTPFSRGADCVQAHPKMVLFFRGENQAQDETVGTEAQLRGGATYSDGFIGRGFHFNGGQDAFVLPQTPRLHLQEFTIETWLRRARTDVVSDSPAGAAIFSTGFGGYSLAMTHEGRPAVSHVGVSRVDGPALITDTNWHHVAVAKASGSVRFIIDGKMVFEAPQVETFTFETPFAIGSMGQAIGGIYYTFLGDIDELSVYDGALQESEVAAIYAAGAAGKCLSAPNCTPKFGLIGYWKGDGDTRDALTGVEAELLAETSFVDRTEGSAFRLQGRNSGVVLPANDKYNLQDFSMALWMRRGDLQRTSQDFDGAALFAGGYGGYGLAIRNEGTLCISKVGVTRSCSGPMVRDQEWHHVGLTKSGSFVRFYLDGVEFNGTTFDQQFSFETPLGIGCVGGLVQGVRDSFIGDLDDVMLFNRPLSTEEMQQVFSGAIQAGCIADLELASVLDPVVVKAKSEGRHALGIRNSGGKVASDSKLRFPLSEGATLTRYSTNSASCAVVGKVVECDLGALNPGESRQVDLFVEYAKEGEATTTAEVSTSSTEYSTANNTLNIKVQVYDGCLPFPPGLVAWWPAEGNAWNVVGKHTGELQLGSYSPGYSKGLAFEFDGISRVKVNPVEDVSFTQFTWAFWVRRGQTGLTDETLLDFVSTDQGAIHTQITLEGVRNGALDQSGRLKFVVPGTGFIQTQMILAREKWTHVALSRETNGITKLYIDGVESYTTSASQASSMKADVLSLGRSAEDPSQESPALHAFHGELDELMLFDRALSGEQVRQLVLSPPELACREGAGVAWSQDRLSLEPTENSMALLEVRNKGLLAVEDVTVRIEGPSEVNLLSAVVGSEACTLTNGVIECRPGALAPNVSREIRVQFSAQAFEGARQLVARLLSHSTDTYLGDNEARVDVVVQRPCLRIAGLVAWWDFEEKSRVGALAPAFSLSGNPRRVDGVAGKGFQFNGSSSLVLSPSFNERLKPAFSIEGWARRSSVTQVSPAQPSAFLIGADSTGWHFSLHESGRLVFGQLGRSRVESEGLIGDTAWHHVCLTYGQGQVHFFIDGLPSGTVAYDLTYDLNSVFAIGGMVPLSGYGFLGSIDELSLFDRVLTSAEVRDIYETSANGKCFEDLSLASSLPATTYPAGAETTLELHVNNNGHSPAPAAQLLFSLPDGAELRGFENPGGDCRVTGGTVTCELGTVRPGVELTVQLHVRLNTPNPRTPLRSVVRSALQEIVEPNNESIVYAIVQGPCATLPSGLLAWWALDGNLDDFAGTQPLTLAAPTYGPGFLGDSLRLDLPAHPSVDRGHRLVRSAMTFAAWVRPVNLPGFVQVIALFEIPETPLSPVLAIGIRGSSSPGGTVPMGNLCVRLGGQQGLPKEVGDWSDGGAAIPLNEWTHVAVAVDSASHSLATFVNGIEARRMEIASGVITDAGGSFHLGGWQAAATGMAPDLYADGFIGELDEVQLFGAALPKAQIAKLGAREVGGYCVNDLQMDFQLSEGAVMALGEPVDVSLVVTNLGDLSASDVRVTNSLPAFLEWIPTAGGIPASLLDGKIVSTFGAIPGHSSATTTYRVRALAGASGSWQVDLRRGEVDGSVENNSIRRTVVAQGRVLQVRAESDLQSVSESRRRLLFSFTLTPASKVPVTVEYETVNGAAIAGQDFVPASGVLTFEPGVTSISVPVQLVEDSVFEGLEDFELRLKNPVGTVLAVNSVKAFIADNEPVPTLSATDLVVTEGTGKPKSVEVEVRLSSPMAELITVQYATSNGSAKTPFDYLATSGSLSFAPGEISKKIPIQITSDSFAEPTEQFFVTLSNPVGCSLKDAQAVVTILDDDQAENPLSGFAVKRLSEPSRPGAKMEIEIAALGKDGKILTDFNGVVSIAARTGSGHASKLVLTEVYASEILSYIELQNVTSEILDAAGWTLTLFDETQLPAPVGTFVIPAGATLNPGTLLTLNTGSSLFGNAPQRFLLPQYLSWALPGQIDVRPKIGIILQDPEGHAVDAFFAGDLNPHDLLVPVAVSEDLWAGPGLGVPPGSNTQFHRVGNSNHHGIIDWGWNSVSIAKVNESLSTPFLGAKRYEVSPGVAADFVNGVYKGEVSIQEPATAVRLIVEDGNGHSGVSEPFSIPGNSDVALRLTGSASVPAGGGVAFEASVDNLGLNPVSNLTVRIESVSTFGGAKLSDRSNSHGALPYLAFESFKPSIFATVDRLEAGKTATIRFTLPAETPNSFRRFEPKGIVEGLPDDSNPANNEASFLMEVAPLPNNPAGGYLAWWNAADSGTDVTGRHPASLVNVTTVADGRVGTGFRLSGDNAALVVPDADDLEMGVGPGLEMELWLRTEGPDSRHRIHVFSKRDPVSGRGYALMLEAGIPVFELYTGLAGDAPTRAQAISSPKVTDGRWHQVVLIASFNDFSNARISIDGAGEIRTLFIPRLSFANDSSLVFGGGATVSTSEAFHGWMDEIVVSRRDVVSPRIPSYLTGSSGRQVAQLTANLVFPRADADTTLWSTLPSGVVGQPYRCEFQITNAGPYAAASSQLQFTWSPGARFVRADAGPGGRFEVTATGVVTLLLPGLEAGRTHTVALEIASDSTEVLLSPAFVQGMAGLVLDPIKPLYINFHPDSDGDGIEDDWETLNGLSAFDPSDAGRDEDGDGLSNGAEFRLGTSPLDASSNLRLESAVGPGGGIDLQWVAQPHRQYQLVRKTSVDAPEWQVIATHNTDTLEVMIVTDVTPGLQGAFYAVRVMP